MKTLQRHIQEKLVINKNSNYSKYCPKSKTELQEILRELIKTRGCNGDFNDIDVSYIEDLSWLFADLKNFAGDISGWDVSKVTDMSNMFYECKNLKTKPKLPEGIEDCRDVFYGCCNLKKNS